MARRQLHFGHLIEIHSLRARAALYASSKATDRRGIATLHWFKLRDVSRFFAVFQDRFVATASKCAIPKERYRDYGILQA